MRLKGTHRRCPWGQTFENKSVFTKSTWRPGRQRKKGLSNQNSRRKPTNQGVGGSSAKCLEEGKLRFGWQKFGALFHRPQIDTEGFTKDIIGCVHQKACLVAIFKIN